MSEMVTPTQFSDTVAQKIAHSAAAEKTTPLRRAVVTAWALHQGYSVEPVTWEGGEGELAEGWVWTGPDGMSVGDRVDAQIDQFPVMPRKLFRELDAECPWGGPLTMADTSTKTPLDSCSPDEIQAWEDWARNEDFDMAEHPLHYLFLDAKTAAARRGWKAGLAFARCHADAERARHVADAEALRAIIRHLRPAAAIVRIDEPTTGRHRYELWTNLTPKPAEHAEFLARFRGVPWTDEPKPSRDGDLPAVGTFG